MRALVSEVSDLDESEVNRLQGLVLEWQLIADLSFADLLLWVPNRQGEFVAVAQCRPSGISTSFLRDITGQVVGAAWEPLIRDTFARKRRVETSAPDWFGRSMTRVRGIPVEVPSSERQTDTPIAVITQHINLSDSRTPSRMELAYEGCADALLTMVQEGNFPDLNAPSGPRRGAPRVSDGIIRLDVEGTAIFASPNAMSAIHALGYDDELEGQNFAEVISKLVVDNGVVDESLPLVVTGKAPWRSDVDVKGQTVTLRSIPLTKQGSPTGALVLARDVTELRRQEQELLTKDATIREIHHRVKNNLQTVSSLLRIQARRTHSDEANAALLKAMRRVESIAVVHDTLSSGLEQTVDFDSVFDRVLNLTVEVADPGQARIKPIREGSFGQIPSNYATALALALTELVTNAVVHGLKGNDGQVRITAAQTTDQLVVVVSDTGGGLPEGKVGSGLGTQIIRTLIEGELSGTIDWHTLLGTGTEVTITIPKRW